MRNAINWKLFGILLAATVLTSLMVLPYAMSLASGFGLKMTPLLLAAQMIQVIVMFSIAIFIGLYLAKRVGFGLPILEGILKGEDQKERFRAIWRPSVGLGALAAVLIIVFSFLFKSADLVKAEMAVPAWKSFLASFYGGVAEEILLRLFMMTLFVWIISKIWKTAAGKASAGGIWLAIILSSVIFGLGHLPITAAVTAITPMIVLRAILLNGIGGVIFGWLYWKKGLESAMLSHFSADIVLHVITPFLVTLFV